MDNIQERKVMAFDLIREIEILRLEIQQREQRIQQLTGEIRQLEKEKGTKEEE